MQLQPHATCGLCCAYVHDLTDVALRALNRRLIRVVPDATKEFQRALAACVVDKKLYKTVKDGLELMIEFHGKPATEETFLESVPAMASAVKYLAPLSADVCGCKDEDMSKGLRTLAFTLFIEFFDVHDMHTQTTPFKDPFGRKSQKNERVIEEEIVAEVLQELDPLYS